MNPFPSLRNVYVLTLLGVLTACASLTAQFDISASSYLGGSGTSSRVTGSVIQSDGTLVLAANLVSADPAAPLKHTIGVGGNAAIIRLSPDGRQILSVTRVADVVHDLSSDRYDNLYVAAGDFGLMKFNPTADELLWTQLDRSRAENVGSEQSQLARL